MNRGEYANAVRDLLALEVDPATLLPADDSSNGFDNIADVLGISPALLERYVSAAARISRMAVGDPDTAPLDVTYTVKGDLSQTGTLEGLPPGTRGGTVIHHNFPLDGEYLIKLSLAKRQLRPGLRRRSRRPGTRSHHRRPTRQAIQARRSGYVFHARNPRPSHSS